MPSLRSHCTLLGLSVPLLSQKCFPDLYTTYAWKCLLLVDVNALLWDSVNAVKVIGSLSNSMRLRRTRYPYRGCVQ